VGLQGACSLHRSPLLQGHLLCCSRCHQILSNLRKPGERGYKIPRGFLFNYITCANYTAGELALSAAGCVAHLSLSCQAGAAFTG